MIVEVKTEWSFSSAWSRASEMLPGSREFQGQSSQLAVYLVVVFVSRATGFSLGLVIRQSMWVKVNLVMVSM
jgi:hypothetical protein